MLIFFGDQATEILREYSVIQSIPDSQDLVVEKRRYTYFWGSVVHRDTCRSYRKSNFANDPACDIYLDEVPEEQLTSAIYLEPFNLPTLEVGMKVIYK